MATASHTASPQASPGAGAKKPLWKNLGFQIIVAMILGAAVGFILRWLRLSEQIFRRISGAPAGFRLPRSAEAG